MRSNVALLDRTVRIWAGMMILASPLLELATGPYNLLGLVLIGTGAVGFCPVYRLFGKTIAPPPRSDVAPPGSGEEPLAA